MQDKLEAIWAALDELAVAAGQPDVARQMLASNRQLMLTYLSLFLQQQQPRPVPNGKPTATPTAP